MLRNNSNSDMKVLVFQNRLGKLRSGGDSVMDISCSFQRLVGGYCALDKRNKVSESNATTIPLLSCNKDISGHKKAMGISDVETEVELILARASIFTLPSDISKLTICASHRSSLGIGWRKGSQRCRVPAGLCRHAEEGKSRKADRGINKALSRTILRRTGIFVAAGSGTCVKVFFIICYLL